MKTETSVFDDDDGIEEPIAVPPVVPPVVPSVVPPVVPPVKKVDVTPVPDDGIDFSRPARKKKTPQSPDESFNNLKKAKEEAVEKNRIFTEIFGDNPPDTIKPLFEFVTSSITGPVTAEAVNNIISDLKTGKETIQSLQEQITEREDRISKLDIRESKHFESNYSKPYKDAAEALYLEFAMIISDGEGSKVLGPNATSKLNNIILNKAGITATDVKIYLTEFAKEFKAETGEDAVLPSVSSLMSAIRNFDEKRNSMHHAYTNWKTIQKEDEDKAKTKASQDQEQMSSAKKKDRLGLVSKAYRNFDIENTPLSDDAIIQEAFKEEHKLIEDIYSGTNVPAYDDLISRGVKSRLWDKHAPAIASMIARLEVLEKKERSTNFDGKGFVPGTVTKQVSGSVFDD